MQIKSRQPQTHHNYNFYNSNTYNDVSTKIQAHLTQWLKDSTKIDLPKLYSEFEYDHSFIQWLFPNFYKSMFNYNSHALTIQERDLMIQDEQILQKLLLFYQLFLKFLGINVNSDGQLCIEDKQQFSSKTSNHNHNLMRIQRILACLSVLGHRQEALNFLEFLKVNLGKQLYQFTYSKYEQVKEELNPSLPIPHYTQTFNDQKSMYIPKNYEDPSISFDILTRQLVTLQTHNNNDLSTEIYNRRAAEPIYDNLVQEKVKLPQRASSQMPQIKNDQQSQLFQNSHNNQKGDNQLQQQKPPQQKHGEQEQQVTSLIQDIKGGKIDSQYQKQAVKMDAMTVTKTSPLINEPDLIIQNQGPTTINKSQQVVQNGIGIAETSHSTNQVTQVNQVYHNYYFYKSNTYNEVSTKIRIHLNQWLKDSTKINLLNLYSDLDNDKSFIQWLFPNFYQSVLNNESYPLTFQERNLMIQDEQILQKLLLFYQLFLRFLGILYQPDGKLSIQDRKQFSSKTTKNNHNLMRIQTILACLSILGHRQEALNLLEFLKVNLGKQLYQFTYSKYEQVKEELNPSLPIPHYTQTFNDQKLIYIPKNYENPNINFDILTRQLVTLQTHNNNDLSTEIYNRRAAEPIYEVKIDNLVQEKSKLPLTASSQTSQMQNDEQKQAVISKEQPSQSQLGQNSENKRKDNASLGQQQPPQQKHREQEQSFIPQMQGGQINQQQSLVKKQNVIPETEKRTFNNEPGQISQNQEPTTINQSTQIVQNVIGTFDTSQNTNQIHHNYHFFKSNTYQDVSTKIQNHLNQWLKDSKKINLPKLYSEFEDDHSFVQWLFPNFYKSMFNYNSHALTFQERDLMIKDEQILQKLLLFYQLFLKFLGINVNSDGKLSIQDRKQFSSKTSNHNHNLMRIQRILACLSVLGHRKEALKFLDLLKDNLTKQLYQFTYSKYEQVKEELNPSLPIPHYTQTFNDQKSMYIPKDYQDQYINSNILTRQLVTLQTTNNDVTTTINNRIAAEPPRIDKKDNFGKPPTTQPPKKMSEMNSNPTYLKNQMEKQSYAQKEQPKNQTSAKQSTPHQTTSILSQFPASNSYCSTFQKQQQNSQKR